MHGSSHPDAPRRAEHGTRSGGLQRPRSSAAELRSTALTSADGAVTVRRITTSGIELDLAEARAHRYRSVEDPDALGRPPRTVLLVVLEGGLRLQVGAWSSGLIAGSALLYNDADDVVGSADDAVRFLRLSTAQQRLPMPMLTGSPPLGPIVDATVELFVVFALGIFRSDGPDVAPSSGEAVERALVSLQVGLLEQVRWLAVEQAARTGAVDRIAVQSCIDLRLHDPTLDARAIAVELGVSVRAVHLALEGSGSTVRRQIRRQRIEEVLRTEGRADRPARVDDLARAHGFTGAEQLRRAFLAVTGIPFREWWRS